MATQAARQWGTTPPISTSLPTEKELALNDSLIAELKRQNNFEAPQDTEKRFVANRQLISTKLTSTGLSSYELYKRSPSNSSSRLGLERACPRPLSVKLGAKSLPLAAIALAYLVLVSL